MEKSEQKITTPIFEIDAQERRKKLLEQED
jgi:hypothetical protein